MSTKRKRAVLSIKDKQIIFSRLDKGDKGTNLAQEFGLSKQQISGVNVNATVNFAQVVNKASCLVQTQGPIQATCLSVCSKYKKNVWKYRVKGVLIWLTYIE